MGDDDEGGVSSLAQIYQADRSGWGGGGGGLKGHSSEQLTQILQYCPYSKELAKESLV